MNSEKYEEMTMASSIWICQSSYTNHMTTLNILFNVTYYLELQHCYNYFLYISFFANNGHIGYMDTIEH